MENIVFTLEFYDLQANQRANSYLQKGWQLLHVGSKHGDGSDDNGNYYLYTVYVVGANKQQYEQYLKDEKESSLQEDKLMSNFVD
ncbi:MAG: hypothetical protein LBT37_06310 [Lactobacillaceae bacterium]|jgi:hypothetical protein|nr:hypothetical protein [Lactobacillaceae bacterium]